MNGVPKIKSLGQFGDIRGVGVHIVPVGGLRGAAMSASIMRNDAITLAEEKHHLRVPVVG